MDAILTTKQLSELMSTSERTLRFWASSKTIPSHKIGDKLYFRQSEIMALLGGSKEENQTDPVVDWLETQLEKLKSIQGGKG